MSATSCRTACARCERAFFSASESSALVGMSSEIFVETKVRSGQIKPYMHGQVGSEVYYLNTYRAVERGGEVLLAPRMLGEVHKYSLGEREDRILITVESFLAAEENVDIETAWRGASKFRMSSGLEMLRCSGDGQLLLSSFGAVHTVELGEDKSFAVDRGHLVGFTDKVQLRVRQLGGVRSTLLRGQEIIFELSGPGKVYLQTRSQDMFLDWIQNQLQPN